MKIDFSQVEIYTGIAKKACIVQDIREVFADALYSQSVGLKSHALALKIFNSNGAEEHTCSEQEGRKDHSYWSARKDSSGGCG